MSVTRTMLLLAMGPLLCLWLFWLAKLFAQSRFTRNVTVKQDQAEANHPTVVVDGLLGGMLAVDRFFSLHSSSISAPGSNTGQIYKPEKKKKL
jgi:hypothetical protein